MEIVTRRCVGESMDKVHTYGHMWTVMLSCGGHEYVFVHVDEEARTTAPSRQVGDDEIAPRYLHLYTLIRIHYLSVKAINITLSLPA